ncbi:MAG: TolC family protein [bacterium]
MRQKVIDAIAVCALTVVSCSQSLSQTALSLEQCIELARSNSPALLAAGGAIHSSELAKRELSSAAYPQIKAAANASYAPLPPPWGYDPALSNGGQVAGQIILNQSLYDGGVRQVKYEQFGFDADRLSKERAKIARDLTFGLKQAFIEALRAQQEILLQQQSVEQLADYLGLVKRLYNGGSAGYTDVLKTDVQLETARLALQKADESLAVAKYSLSEFMGVPVDPADTLAGSLDSLVRNTSDSVGVSGNLDLAIAELGVRRSMLDIELARREWLPDISLTADAGYLSSVQNLKLAKTDRFNALGYSVGIGVGIPLFNWGATGLRIEQRSIESEGLRFQAERLRRFVTSEFAKTREQLKRSKVRLDLIRSNISKAEENYLLTKSKFAGGVTLSIEVLAAQQLLTDTRLAELQTLADIQNLAAKLEQLNTR